MTIYFMQSNAPDGPVKIGYTSRRTSVRRAEGQTFCCDDLTLLVEADGSMQDERRLHDLFSEIRMRGEWFRYEPPLQQLVLHLMEGYTLGSYLLCVDDDCVTTGSMSR